MLPVHLGRLYPMLLIIAAKSAKPNEFAAKYKFLVFTLIVCL